MISRKSQGASRGKVFEIHRPWIPPPAKTTSLKKLNLETKKHKKNETDSLQDIKQKISELDIFVKSLDSVLGKIRTNEATETNHTVTEHNMDETTITSNKIDNVHKMKVKEYKKKIKILLKVFHLTELETKKLRDLLEQKDTNLEFLIKDRDKLKLKLTDSNKEKLEIESKLENIMQRLIEMEKFQAKRSLKTDKDQICSLNKELEKLKEGNNVLQNLMTQKETEINNLKDKLARTLKSQNIQDSKKVERKLSDTKLQDLEKLRNKVETLENQNCAFLKSLKLMETQVDDANASISRLTTDLNKTEKILNKTKLQLEESRVNVAQNEDFVSHNVLTEFKIFQEEIAEKRIRISLLEESLQRKTDEITELTNDKAKMKADYETKLRDCERQLAVSINTNRSLQNYLTHLKNSYAAVFSQPNL